MGYPMTYRRVVGRNHLDGDYARQDGPTNRVDRATIAGDLRRLEADQRDESHLALYAKRTGLTAAQCKAVLGFALKRAVALKVGGLPKNSYAPARFLPEQDFGLPFFLDALLCKVLCHNICCVIQSMHELGISPAFPSLAPSSG